MTPHGSFSDEERAFIREVARELLGPAIAEHIRSCPLVQRSRSLLYFAIGASCAAGFGIKEVVDLFRGAM